MLKIAFIGAGSIGFTRALVRDILSVPEFKDNCEIAFTDISARNLDMVYRLTRRDMDANGVKSKLTATLNRRTALKDANYVFSVVRVGGLEAFQTDVDIPLKYGIDQCVGDTLCAGGIMYGQRNIPVVLDFCKDMAEVSAPDVRFFNYANPMAMNTWACLDYGWGVESIGLCHGVTGGHQQITEVIELLINQGRKKEDPRYKKLTRKDVDIICAGINHQTWYTQVRYNGEDWTGRLLEGFTQHPLFKDTEKVRIDMLRRFGYYSTESNGHLSEYVPWYRKRPQEIGKWIDMRTWIYGETGGYLRVCTESRRWFQTDFPNWMKDKPLEYKAEKRSHEEGSFILEGLETGRVHRGFFNVRNQGCISNLPADCVIEAPGYVDRNGINMPVVGELPLACAAVCNNSINVQRLAKEAAVYGDVDYLRQAMLLDPLIGAVCNPPEVWQLADEMLVAQAAWLPQYKKEIEKAKKRLRTGKRISTKANYKGAARKHTKSVGEMKKWREEATKQAAAADKGMGEKLKK